MVEVTLSFWQMLATGAVGVAAFFAFMTFCPKQALAKGGSTQRYNKREPAPRLDEMRNTLIDIALPVAERVGGDTDRINSLIDFGNTSIGNIEDMSGRIPGLFGQIDSMMGGYTDTLTSGNIPQPLYDNMMSNINTEMEQGAGQALNRLAGRGILSSQVTTDALSNLANNAANAMAKEHANLWGQTLQGYKGGLDSLNSAIGGANQAISSMGDAVNTAWNTYYAPMKPAFDIWSNWQRSYDQREDYDTVVKQGK